MRQPIQQRTPASRSARPEQGGLAIRDGTGGPRARGISTLFIRALLVWLLCAGGMAATSGLAAEETGFSEQQIKAADLLSFPKYIDWPASAFGSSNSPIVVGVYGNDEVAAQFRKLSNGRSVYSHPIVFKRITAIDDCVGCQIVFVGASEEREVPAIVARLQGSSVLMVGESDDFLDKGGIINLKRRESKVRLEVNLGAAHKADLQISSKLLNVADRK